MSIEEENNAKISVHTDECYEERAGQEKEYLEEGVENLRERELLVSEAAANNVRRAEAHAAEEIEHAAEELVIGDSDDSPLSDEGVVELLDKTSNE
jgi:DNA-directed RNA polymerase specialized sigma54-like protein